MLVFHQNLVNASVNTQLDYISHPFLQLNAAMWLGAIQRNVKRSDIHLERKSLSWQHKSIEYFCVAVAWWLNEACPCHYIAGFQGRMGTFISTASYRNALLSGLNNKDKKSRGELAPSQYDLSPTPLLCNSLGFAHITSSLPKILLQSLTGPHTWQFQELPRSKIFSQLRSWSIALL